MYRTNANEYLRAEAIEWGPRILFALLIILATWAIARAAKWALTRVFDKTPALKRHRETGTQSMAEQIGTIVKLIIWLVGIVAALGVLGLAQILAPINQLTTNIFAFLPRLLGAGLIFFLGLVVARIVRQLVETVLSAANVDGLMARAGIGSTSGTVRSDPEAVPPGTTPGATRATLAKAVGILAFAAIIIPVSIAALQVLGIEAISGPAINMLNQIAAAIPNILTAALWLLVAFIAGRFVKTLLEGVLPPLGVDNAIRATGMVPASTSPSRIIANVAFVAIIVVAAIEAAKQLGGGTLAAFLIQVTELGSKVIFGTLIIVVGAMFARLLANLIGGTGEGWTQSIVRYATIALFTAIGLTFMGLANEIVILAFGLILGSGAIAAALAFGLGGREAAGRILNAYADKLTSEAGPPAPPPAPKRVTKQAPPASDDGQPPLV
ncbi:mechanosensitive ion channel [Sphingomonas mesophila]|uniref:mechanosensitive ion channel n=1 Tax=Sphingomonas mesophila TaxID=2303576 RepID=UPI000E56C933|nr:mechanosensitive ion channel [Sphingomonas mesophila]